MSFPYHKQNVCPLAIDIAVHYATCCDDFPNLWSPAQATIIKQFALQGLIQLTSDEQKKAGWTGKWIGTDKCRAWVTLMCRTPFPIEMWVDPRTEEIL